MIGLQFRGLVSRLSACMAALALAAMLAGCSGSSEELTCPAAAPAPDLDAVAIFAPGAGTDNASIQAAGKIFDVSRQCEQEKGGILINSLITVNAIRLAPQVSRAEYVYFVAVVDSTRNILNEQRFTLDAQFGNQDFRTYVEKISVHLPLQHVSAGDGYAIIVGFQLTPEQLEFNRAHKQQS
ncbi:MAG: hypothetical protein ACLPL5_11485 [Stellaceae bacterium]|jgi:hypothetical protein